MALYPPSTDSSIQITCCARSADGRNQALVVSEHFEYSVHSLSHTKTIHTWTILESAHTMTGDGRHNIRNVIK